VAGSETRARAHLGTLAAIPVGVAALAAVYLLPTGDWLLAVVESIRGSGASGVAIFAAAYVVATVLLLPGSVLTAGAGFAYGPLWGTLLVSPVSVAAATLAFVLGRTVARAWIARRIAGSPRFAAIDEAIGESGFKIVLLLRLSPLFPFNLLNYALGLTRLSLRDYVVASALGMLPGTILYVYLGSLVTSASELAAGGREGAGASRSVLYWGGLAATVGVTWLLTRSARRALSRTIEARRATPLPAAKEVTP
jgi:uncharacterized membrane protein YdjX (TVP38/TMEM64 family)